MHVTELVALIDARHDEPDNPLVILAEEVKRVRGVLEDLATSPNDSAAYLKAKAERALR